MGTLAAFYARSYPAFRAARIYRVLVGDRGLYFVRTKSLISASDAGHREFFASGKQRLISNVISSLAEKSAAANEAEIAGTDPDVLVKGSKHNFFVAKDDVIASSLAPGALFGASLARWKTSFKDRKPMALEIEDQADLDVAREHLPRILGDSLKITLK